MKRRLALALAALASLVPAIALGLGLGDIRLHSALNQPLDAEIELISATDSEIDALRVHLAGADLFDRYGIERIEALQSFKFTVVRRDDKSAFVRVTSDVAMREPFMTFLVEAQWPRGRLLREYTLLLDPPVLAEAPQSYTETTPLAVEPAPASVSTEPAAAFAAPAMSSPPAAATVSAEPGAEPVIATPVAPQPTSESGGAPEAAAPAYEAGSYGPVKRNEALWTIAKNLRADQAVTINQMMIALYRANPEAFRNNINVLKRGAILRIPDVAELNAISAREATAEAVRHHQDWEATRVAVAPSAAPSEPVAAVPPRMDEPAPAPVERAPEPTPTPAPVPAPVVSAPEPVATPPTSSSLSIVAPADDAGLPSTDPAARVADLEKQLAEAKAAGTNTKRKRDRIARLETELEQARAAIVVPSDTLSQLQTSPSMSPATTPSLPAVPATLAAAPATVAAQPAAPATQEKGLLDSILDNLLDPLVLGLLVGIPLLVALGIVGAKQYKAKAAARKAQSDLSAWATEPSGDDDKTVVGGDEPTMQASGRGGQGSEERTVIRGPDPALLAPTGETVAIPEDQVEKTVMLPRDELDKTIMQTMIVSKAPTPEPEPDVSHDTVVGGTPLKLDENDPMSEADFHMAYGLYDQAADLIKKASQREPGRRDLKLKLLEIYFSAGSKAAFVAEAKALRQTMGAAPDADWANVAIFGKQIAPEEGFFNEAVTSKATTIDFDASMGGGSSPSSAIDLAFDEPSVAPAAAPAAAPAPAPKADEPLEFDLGDFKLDDAAPAAVAAPAKGEHTDSQSDFDKALAELSSFVETNVPKDLSGGTAVAASEVDLGSLELDDSALSIEEGGESGSEIDTKLDLARAYIDMGDPGSAKGILEEVVADGDDKQKSEAQKLLTQLG